MNVSPSCELFFRIFSSCNFILHFQDLKLGKGRTRENITFSKSLIMKDGQLTAKHTGPALPVVTTNQSLPLLTQPALHTKSAHPGQLQTWRQEASGLPRAMSVSYQALSTQSMSFFSSLHLAFSPWDCYRIRLSLEESPMKKTALAWTRREIREWLVVSSEVGNNKE